MKSKWFQLAALILLVVISLLSCIRDRTIVAWREVIAKAIHIDSPGLILLICNAKLWHVILYFLLTLLLLKLFRRKFWLGPILALGIGAVMESAQIFIPSRQAHLFDLLLNFAGIAGAMLLVWGFDRPRAGTSATDGADIL